tara:strand:- start:672 stop:1808 length:1137 start_codon:yes stop_codon:yes gene_type:complete
MFRGGAVDSRGTGITSGLMDTPKYATGGRVGYQNAGVVTGGDLISKGNIPIDLSALANTRFSAGVPFSYELTPIKDKVEEAVEETETDDRGILQKFYDMFNPSKETIEDRLKKQDEGMTTFDEKMENIGIITNKQKQKIADEIKSGAVDTGDAGTEAENDANLAAGNVAGTGASGNEPSNVEISAQDLIRENAELFKELLNETKEKDLKRARVSDVSDYLLKFFEGSQKEGATVGSAAADVAAFATSKPSATDRAIEAAKKTDQTATALAINDYIAGKRSKEQIKTALALNAAKVKMAEGTLGDKILKAKGSGPVTVTVIRDVLRSEPEFVGMPIQEFDSSKETIEYSPGDENKIFIDTITKETFTYDKNKRKVPIYG